MGRGMAGAYYWNVTDGTEISLPICVGGTLAARYTDQSPAVMVLPAEIDMAKLPMVPDATPANADFGTVPEPAAAGKSHCTTGVLLGESSRRTVTVPPPPVQLNCRSCTMGMVNAFIAIAGVVRSNGAGAV